MTAAEPAPAARPRHRKQLIMDAAGRAFNERGYHAASMDDIAATVGITATALYRHFPNKYALFAECVTRMADRLVEAVDGLPSDAPLARLLEAVARVTVTHRSSGGTYRWEARYLERGDRLLLRKKFGHVVERVTRAIRATRADDANPAAPGEWSLEPAQLCAVGALGVIGSITTHHVAIGQRRAEQVLVESALRVCATDPTPVRPAGPAPRLPSPPEPSTRRDEILAAAIPLFEQHGFPQVTMGSIAESVGLAPSALYRHYPAKVDILAAACLQAAGLLAQAVEQELHGVDDPGEAVWALAATYVAYSFEHTSLTSVAEAELGGLPVTLQQPLISAQREHIAIWERHLSAVLPTRDPRRIRVLVHAGFGVVVEAGRRLRWQDSPDNRAAVTTLMVSALGVPTP